jgi:hypothetical protein
MRRSGSAPVAVVGMHRSGTSATTRALNLLGLDLGDPDGLFDALEWDNAAGYWEQRSIVAIDDDILTALDAGVWQPHLPAGWERSPAVVPFEQRARDALEALFAGRRLWGWKDPRATLTLPFWRRVVPDLRCVICVRDPLEVRASLQRRAALNPTPIRFPDDPSTLDALWLSYNAAALRHTAGARRIFVFYDDWFEDPDHQTRRLAAFLHGRGRVSRRTRAQIADFVSDELRHHRRSTDQAARDADLPVELTAFYLLLRAVHGGNDGPAGLAGPLDALAQRIYDRPLQADAAAAAVGAEG